MRYLQVSKTFRPVLTDDDDPKTERRPELTEAWATIMNEYIEFVDADPLTISEIEATFDTQ